MNITKNVVASIDYTLKNDGGEILDSSSGREPLAYLHGHGNLIPGLEQELEGKTKGDKLVAVIQPADAYGVRSDELLQDFPLDQFQNPAEVQVGVQFQVKYGEEQHIATVTKVENNMVSVDMNHPLADLTLHFDVEVMDAREATAEELEHGHVHGPGGHHH